MADTVVRPSSRKMPFSLGGRVAAGSLLPDGPDPLYDVDTRVQSDILNLPWERRNYDAWTTSAFRALALAWLASMLAQNPWMKSTAWQIREQATAARLSTLRFHNPRLIVTITRAEDDHVFEVVTDWTAAERDDAATVNAKLLRVEAIFNELNIAYPP